MLKAYLFQTSHCFFKKKLNVVLTILAIALVALMVLITGFMSSETFATRDVALISGGISIISVVMFNFAMLGVSSGQLLYTNPDVNFYMAGPFTRKFNLIIPITTSIKSSLYIMFVIACQAALLSRLFGFGSLDMLFMLFCGFFINALGNILSQVLIAWLHEKQKVLKFIGGVFFAFDFVWLGTTFLKLKEQAGSFGAISSLGAPKILAELGSSVFLKVIPVGGWFTMIINGIYSHSAVTLILGIVLTVAAIAIIGIIMNIVDFDYYEKGIASAQKMADRLAAKSAGVEEMAVDTTKIKVDDTTSFNKGSGASVFFYKHLLENTRFSKLFFVNKTVLLYKVIALCYGVFMTKVNGDSSGFIAGLFMMLLFDITAFAGGKSVLELNRPYFYMIPEKMSKKLMYNVFGSVPEILLNGVLAAGVIAFMSRAELNVHACIAAFIMTVFIDLISLFVSNTIVTLLGTLGKTPLLLVRQFIIMGLIGISCLGGLIAIIIAGSSIATFLYGTCVGLLIMLIISWILASLVIERKELI